MEYLGPKFDEVFNDLPFCKDLLPTGGFIKATLVKVIDGDTAIFKVNGIVETVRFMVVDTPKYVDILGNTNEAEEYGESSKDYVEKILLNSNEIYLESDPYNNLRDDTNSRRLLAWIWVDGKLLNYLLVKDGLALNNYIINPNMKYLKELDEALNYAKLHKLNLHK